MMRYVEVCELLARAQETYYIMKQLAIFCDKRIWWKLENIQECLVKPSSFSANYQLPSLKSWCLLECIHCRRERILIKVVRSLPVAMIRLCDHW